MSRIPLPCVCLILCLCACEGGNSRADTTGLESDGFPAPNQEMIVMAARSVLREQGFAVDPDRSGEEQGLLTSRWKTQLAPFSGHGFREQAIVRVKPLANRSNYFHVETNVIREQNMNIDDPSNPVRAEWKNPTREPEMELLISRRIEMHFLSGEVSESFRARNRIPGARSRVDAVAPAAPSEDPLGFP